MKEQKNVVKIVRSGVVVPIAPLISKRPKPASITLPGSRSKTGLQLPDNLTIKQWEECGRVLCEVESASQWWLGDWWNHGSKKYGERYKAVAEGIFGDRSFQTLANYGWVAGSVTTSRRREVLSFKHHAEVAALKPAVQTYWLDKAIENRWSSNELKTAIARQAAIERTAKAELDAERLGKFTVLYGDPPWRYENPPMGGSNRSIENHYPTMTLEEICALPVSQIAHDNSVLLLWATSPKLLESLQVIESWGFTYRTSLVWVKDKIGMGYYARERHEALLVAKRGELPPPPPEARPDSVIEAPRLEHSAKPVALYEIIDLMYPSVRKIELFGRTPKERYLWTAWGNQANGEQTRT
jgi:N6-adenosine-specific RNA methylase IME4